MCTKHYQRDCRQANPELYRKRRADNPEPSRAANRRWRANHLEEARARDRLYAELNPAKMKEKARLRYADGGLESSAAAAAREPTPRA